jgi:hypothetical protein
LYVIDIDVCYGFTSFGVVWMSHWPSVHPNIPFSVLPYILLYSLGFGVTVSHSAVKTLNSSTLHSLLSFPYPCC